jgi:hypothetical protein
MMLTESEQLQLHLLLQKFGPTLQGLQDIEKPVTAYLEPMNRFFQQHTSSVAPGQPLVLGDVLHARLAAVELSMSTLQNSGVGGHNKLTVHPTSELEVCQLQSEQAMPCQHCFVI